MTPLTPDSAAEMLAVEMRKEPRPQALLDFLNDSNYEGIEWEEPPADVEFFVERCIRLFYGDMDREGHLVLRAENCLQEGALRLAKEGMGVGKATIRAQLHYLSKVCPDFVVALMDGRNGAERSGT